MHVSDKKRSPMGFWLTMKPMSLFTDTTKHVPNFLTLTPPCTVHVHITFLFLFLIQESETTYF